MLRTIVALVLLMASAGTAAAQDHGLYVSGFGGATFGDDLNSGATTRITTGTGAFGGAALGWAFGNGIRAELEGSYGRRSIESIDTLRITGLQYPLGQPGGDVNSARFMTNAFYDFNWHLAGFQISPYIGIGIGYAGVDLSNANGQGNQVGLGPVDVRFGSGSAFAYQGMVGASTPFAGIPRLRATLEYRYFETDPASVTVTRTSTTGLMVNGQLATSYATNTFRLSEQSVLVGLRYSFDTVP
jgi:OmpA-OmpF porin, OOP family